MQDRFSVKIIRGDDPASKPARELESNVFYEAFGNTPQLLKQEYEPYENNTFFIEVKDTFEDKVAGSARMLVTDFRSAKSVKDLTNSPWNLEQAEVEEFLSLFKTPTVVDVATTAVAPQYRKGAISGPVTVAIYHSIFHIAQALKVNTLVTVYDRKAWYLVNRFCSNAWQQYPGVTPGEYLGSAVSIPSWCNLDEVKELTDRNHPLYYEYIFQSEKMGEGITYPQWDKAAAQLKFD